MHIAESSSNNLLSAPQKGRGFPKKRYRRLHSFTDATPLYSTINERGFLTAEMMIEAFYNIFRAPLKSRCSL